MAADAATTTPEPCRSISRPARGETAAAPNPPMLTAPENSALDQPNSSVIGTTKTERVATAIREREV